MNFTSTIGLFLFTWALIMQPVMLAQQATNTKTTLTGRVADAESGEPLARANVRLEQSGAGTTTDLNGEFVLTDLEPGKDVLHVSYIGYATYSNTATLTSGHKRVSVSLVPISYEFNTIVVTGTRTEKKRTEVPIIVNILGPELLESTNARWLLDGLGYQSGVRIEVDCQTCNYSQVRLNGLGGAYSQILVNSRPIFSALSGLYGLEQIPSSMLERVEVIRGGGSALYGANAIAGTINIITREPTDNSYGLSFDNSLIGDRALDRSLDLHTSFVDSERRSGLTVFGSMRNRAAYDANADGYSELPRLRNNSFGLNSFHRVGKHSKVSVDLHSIHEERRGGNKLDLPAHKADQAEDRTHNIIGGGITFARNVPELLSSLSAYVSGQVTDRRHYTGIGGADAYGNTDNLTLVTGIQFSRSHLGFLGGGENTITVGVEGQYDDVFDEIPGYGHRLDQVTQQAGLYLQTDWKASRRLGLLLGLRGDVHSSMGGGLVNPRMNVMYNFTDELQLRASVATGFRAPQAFDADLHVAFAGGGVSLIRIDPGLERERSVSYSASLDFNLPDAHSIWGFTLEGFVTRLRDVFVLEELGPDPLDTDNTILLRKNGGNATVAGASLEFRANYDNIVEVTAGATVQSSLYDDAVAWSIEVEGSKEFLRSPDVYGFYLLDLSLWAPLKLSLSGVLTGPMYVPHVAGAPGVDLDVLNRSGTFLESNLRMAYRFGAGMLPGGLEVFAGVKNMFDAYQKDFDTGPSRDSNYIYGPARPRTVFAGFKIGY